MNDQNKQSSKVEQAAQSAISKRVSQSVATKIAQSAVGKAVGGALGSVVPVIGNLIGALVGGLVAGALTKGAKEVGKAVGTLPFAAVNALNQFANVVAVSVAQAIQVALGSLVLGFGVLALFIAFTLFIINSGAYVVPPGYNNLNNGEGGTAEWPQIDVGASCPIPGGIVFWGSLGNPNTPVQHGSNQYWSLVRASCFQGRSGSYPIAGCYAVNNGNGQCSPGCSTYGFAIDLMYPRFQVAGQPVYLPYINGQSVTWASTPISGSTQGRGLLRAVSPTGEAYEIYVTHLQSSPTGGVSGQVFGNLYALPRPHIHVELRINGRYVPPEFMCQ